jgi:nucleoside-diphosphate-sugar epimerase
MTLLILGYGYLGRRVAQLADQRYREILAVVRDAAKVRPLVGSGVTPVAADLDHIEFLATLPTAGAAVLYLAPPPETGRSDPRMERFCRSARGAKRPAKVVYVSTTGVYGDCGGAWIDESAPTRPGTDRAWRRLAAEQALIRWGRQEQVPVVILRVAGIYGPGRLPLEALRAGRPVLLPADAPWTNRIHVDDLARVCLAALERGADGDLFNVCDGEPGTMTDFFLAVADSCGLPRPPLVSRAEAARQLSPAMLSYLNESRRLDCRHLRDRLGVTLAYPTLEAGLRACRAAEQAERPAVPPPPERG